jgi:hypothetical protein
MMIQEGTYVVHSTKTINDGLRMYVKEIDSEENKALCSLNNGTDVWYDFKDLTVKEEAQPGFI